MNSKKFQSIMRITLMLTIMLSFRLLVLVPAVSAQTDKTFTIRAGQHYCDLTNGKADCSGYEDPQFTLQYIFPNDVRVTYVSLIDDNYAKVILIDDKSTIAIEKSLVPSALIEVASSDGSISGGDVMIVILPSVILILGMISLVELVRSGKFLLILVTVVFIGLAFLCWQQMSDANIVKTCVLKNELCYPTNTSFFTVLNAVLYTLGLFGLYLAANTEYKLGDTVRGDYATTIDDAKAKLSQKAKTGGYDVFQMQVTEIPEDKATGGEKYYAFGTIKTPDRKRDFSIVTCILIILAYFYLATGYFAGMYFPHHEWPYQRLGIGSIPLILTIGGALVNQYIEIGAEFGKYGPLVIIIMAILIGFSLISPAPALIVGALLVVVIVLVLLVSRGKIAWNQGWGDLVMGYFVFCIFSYSVGGQTFLGYNPNWRGNAETLLTLFRNMEPVLSKINF